MSEQSTPDGEPAVSNLLDLTGETVLVTGASGNIGHSIARRLAEAGAQLILHYHRDEASAEALAPELGATTVQADLCEAGAVAAMFMACDATLLVNNAAMQPVQPLEDMDIDAWRAMLRTNLDGPFLVLQAAAHAWGERGGAVVNVASLEGSDPAAGHAHYATSKAGLIMFSRAAALEYGPRGIRVNSVSPGLIHREGIERDWPDGVARWQARAPLGRLGTPNDVADAVLFLLSPAARWISGANLAVDGGMSAQSRW
jgi:NAD(P)-dependent dehydrogenase (short-subunit alcohol dehydrogenase family)